MNRFRKSKKKEEVVVVDAPPVGNLKDQKKMQEFAEFDLANALPSTDDFRTSLLLPKLSARFSMLREQDDPTTKVGKASDDSVLFPRRASRLNLLHQPSVLSDIDEASSISTRPSLVLARADSTTSADVETASQELYTGSIMDRPRRGEGNNLFGGRQKVYKIPVRSSSETDSSHPNLGGKAFYGDDLTLSTFQRMQLKSAMEHTTADGEPESVCTPQSEDDLSNTRITYSSITPAPRNLHPSAVSTTVDEFRLGPNSLPLNSGCKNEDAPKPAPLSISNERGSVKSRRLYCQGLHTGPQNQQSALHRLESLSRQRAGTPELHQLNRGFSKSAGNLQDRFRRSPTMEAPPSLRPDSPPSSAEPITDNNVHGVRSQPTGMYGAVPPLSPPISESEEATALAAALQPEDRGKATALGLFNKPKSTFDEQHFARRQLQMHQGSNTPPLRQPSLSSRNSSQESNGRSRGLSTASYRSTTASLSSQYSNEIRRGERSTSSSAAGSPVRSGAGTFFANFSGSESGDDDDDKPVYPYHAPPTTPLMSEAVNRKSALSNKDVCDTVPEFSYTDLGDLQPIQENEPGEIASHAQSPSLPEKPDSPTLGPSGLGLSGLIQTHLRHDSDKSSIYPPSPRLVSGQFDIDSLSDPAFPGRLSMPNNQGSAQSESWDRYGDGNHAILAPFSYSPPLEDQPIAPTSRSMQLGPTLNTSVPSEQTYNGSVIVSTTTESEGVTNDRRSSPSIRHRRGSSSETQKEREEFANELAERRRKVQEKLKSFAENESRSNSPMAGRKTPELPHGRVGHPFSLAKSKSSKTSHLGKLEPKSMRVLGISSASSPALVHNESNLEDQERPPYGFSKHPNSSSPQVGTERPFHQISRALTHSSTEGSNESSSNRGQSPHASFQSQRERSGSDASGRSKSRTRYRERDDLETVNEVTSHGTKFKPAYDESRSRTPTIVCSNLQPVEAVEHKTMHDHVPSVSSGRYHSGSLSGNPASLDRSVRQVQPASPPPIGTSPRPSPIAPYSAHATPPLHDMSPEASPVIQPTLNAGSNHAVPQRPPGSKGLQKRYVDKSQISEPTFMSSTASVPLVGLPPGASLSNGMELPPVPPMNPRRRRPTATQTIIGALKGDRSEPHVSGNEPTSEQSPFPGEESRSRPKSRFRKSVMGNSNTNNSRARQDFGGGPEIPQLPQKVPVQGGMI